MERRTLHRPCTNSMQRCAFRSGKSSSRIRSEVMNLEKLVETCSGAARSRTAAWARRAAPSMRRASLRDQLGARLPPLTVSAFHCSLLSDFYVGDEELLVPICEAAQREARLPQGLHPLRLVNSHELAVKDVAELFLRIWSGGMAAPGGLD